MLAYGLVTLYSHSHVIKSHQSQFKKVIPSETPCIFILAI